MAKQQSDADRFREVATKFHRVTGELQELLGVRGNDAIKSAKLKEMKALQAEVQKLAAVLKKKIQDN